LGLSPVNRFQEKLALKAIEARLSREDPELAAALMDFGLPWRAPEETRRRERRVLAGAVSALAMLFTLLFAFLWSSPHPTCAATAHTRTTAVTASTALSSAGCRTAPGMPRSG
jgi:hypothetical protein